VLPVHKMFKVFFHCLKNITYKDYFVSLSRFKPKNNMLKSICILFIYIFVVSAGTCQSKRPRQFRMQVYSKPHYKGALQSMRVTNGCKFYNAL
jgi:hypothetical protein